MLMRKYIQGICLEMISNIPKFKGLEPLVSVILTVYNSEDYLKYSLESILNQTLDNIEVIVLGFNLLVQQPVILQTILHLVFSFQVFS
ncbi:glycosyltransferase [Marinospirillum insulare]|uniref:glycosyltransferase n=1 Tax=Marinospirillum insulare TaxID=217169 RepID=UPI003CCB7A56